MPACSRPPQLRHTNPILETVSRIDLSNTSIVFFPFFFFFIPIRPARRSSTCCDFCYLPRLLRHHHRSIIRNTRHSLFPRYFTDAPPFLFFFNARKYLSSIHVSSFRRTASPRLLSRPPPPKFSFFSVRGERAVIKPGS